MNGRLNSRAEKGCSRDTLPPLSDSTSRIQGVALEYSPILDTYKGHYML